MKKKCEISTGFSWIILFYPIYFFYFEVKMKSAYSIDSSEEILQFRYRFSTRARVSSHWKIYTSALVAHYVSPSAATMSLSIGIDQKSVAASPGDQHDPAGL